VNGAQALSSFYSPSQSQCQAGCLPANGCGVWNYLSNGQCSYYSSSAASSTYNSKYRRKKILVFVFIKMRNWDNLFLNFCQDGQYSYANVPNTVYSGVLNGVLLNGAPFNATQAQCQYWCTNPNNVGTAYASCVGWYFSNGLCYYYSSTASATPTSSNSKLEFILKCLFTNAREIYRIGHYFVKLKRKNSENIF
jgi:hypothetical protein